MRVQALSVLALVVVAFSGCSAEPPEQATVPPPVSASAQTSGSQDPAEGLSADGGVDLFWFVESTSVDGWLTVNDTVMGGVSTSSALWDDDALVFAGEVSLANNGGFTSVVSPLSPAIGEALEEIASSERDVLVVEGRGDGRTYVLQLRSGSGGRQQWSQPFTLPPNSGRALLPLADFVATDFRLEPVVPTPLAAGAIDALAVYLVDGQAGPFRIAITRIGAG